MVALSIKGFYAEPEDSGVSRITDLAIHPETGFLVTTNHYDGGLTSWRIAEGGLTKVDAIGHLGAPTAGSEPNLLFIGGSVYSGGGLAQNLVRRPILPDGSFGAAENLGTTTRFTGDLIDLESVQLNSGDQVVYSGIVGSEGLARIRFNSSNEIVDSTVLTSAGIEQIKHVQSLAVSNISGTRMLFTADFGENKIVGWTIDSGGDLTKVSQLDTSSGLWIDGPNNIDIMSTDTKNFLIVASTGSNSISILEIGNGGSFTLTDHVIDDQFTRFADVSSLKVFSRNGFNFVIASGKDDGISVFLVTQDGRLVHRATIEDTAAIGLQNVSAIAAAPTATGIDLVAASASEIGLTHLHLELGELGERLTADFNGGTLLGGDHADLLSGSAADDFIFGGNGDDILIDGDGVDELSGGEGADTFVIEYDGALDTIVDFEIEQDVIDLSDWPMLGSMAQLTWQSTELGISLRYGAEVLNIITSSNTPLALTDFQPADLLGPDRINLSLDTGFPGPPGPTPQLPERIIYTSPEIPSAPEQGGKEIIGSQLAETLFGSALGDSLYGASNSDVLHGLGGNDFLNGGSGTDTIHGGSGNDTIYGGTGRQADWVAHSSTNSTNDILYGGHGNDILFGQSGDDILSGGVGNDLLHGGAGRDTFVFDAGRDKILDFTPYVDLIVIDADLVPVGTTGADILSQFTTVNNNELVFDFGNGNSVQVASISSPELLAWSIDVL